jgi:hypothetical protein
MSCNRLAPAFANGFREVGWMSRVQSGLWKENVLADKTIWPIAVDASDCTSRHQTTAEFA